MIDDTDSDIEFGKKFGMICVKTIKNLNENGKQDYNFYSISNFSQYIYI